jgi:splicing factor U2AF 65 kDa subunit
VNPDLTDGVVAGMNKLDLAGQKLSVQRVPVSAAAVLLKPTSSTQALSNTNLSSQTINNTTISPDQPPSLVVCLSNMTTEDDLTDNTLYEELVEDVADECNKHGMVKAIVIPRSTHSYSIEKPSIVGKIFVKFSDVPGAAKAIKAISGRRFNGKVVIAEYFDQEIFDQKVSY